MASGNRLTCWQISWVGSAGVATYALGVVDLAANQRWVLGLSYQLGGNQIRTSSANYALDVNYSSYLVKVVPLSGVFWFMLSGIVGLLSFFRIKKGK